MNYHDTLIESMSWEIAQMSDTYPHLSPIWKLLRNWMHLSFERNLFNSSKRIYRPIKCIEYHKRDGKYYSRVFINFVNILNLGNRHLESTGASFDWLEHSRFTPIRITSAISRTTRTINTGSVRRIWHPMHWITHPQWWRES